MTAEALRVNRIFHDHECGYYDRRFGIAHGSRDAERAVHEVEDLLGRPLRAGERAIDVGTGTGWLAAGVRRTRPDVRITAVDLSDGMLGAARSAGAWPLLQGDAGRLPVADASVDLVLGRGVLHHLDDWAAALGDWRRVCVDGGAVVLTSEPTAAVERHGAVLVRGLLGVLRRQLSPEEEFWELASMAANLHVFDPASLAEAARNAGYTQATIRTAAFASTLVLTASYVTHGRIPALAERLPWRAAEEAGHAADRWVWNRVLPPGSRHVVQAVLRA